ncbi:hypothetical protein F5051DRAFT_434092 [Lentinula edodes]|nr:hypothetical protein F5051DRAFT_434092 [Lentinula edodes]
MGIKNVRKLFTTDSETGNPTPTGWWRRQTYHYCSYYLDSDGMIQKIYHSPDAEESTSNYRHSSSTPRPTMTDIEDLIVGLTTSASISSTTDTQILRKMDPASTPKPTTCAIDSQIPECTENVSMLLSPEALFGQMNLASSLPGHTMDNLDTRGKNVNLDMNSVCKFSLTSPSVQISANPSEGPGRPADDPSRFPEGPGHPSEGSGRPSEGPERPKWFQNVVQRIETGERKMNESERFRKAVLSRISYLQPWAEDPPLTRSTFNSDEFCSRRVL